MKMNHNSKVKRHKLFQIIFKLNKSKTKFNLFREIMYRPNNKINKNKTTGKLKVCLIKMEFKITDQLLLVFRRVVVLEI